MLGAGGIFVVILSIYFGRLPVLFWFLVVAICTAAWCGAAITFDSFMAARIVNGFFSTVGQAVSTISAELREDIKADWLIPGWPNVYQ